MAAQNLNYFTKTLVINLDSRPEKLARMTDRLNKIGVTSWERVAAERPSKSLPGMPVGAYGLALTHAKIFKRAMLEKWESVLILEDDAVFRDDIQEVFAPIPDELERLGKSGSPWDIFFLGYRLMAPIEESLVLKHIIRSRAVCHTHAIAIHNRAFTRLHHLAATAKRPVDLSYGYQQFGVSAYCANLLLSVQEPGWSDIAECKVQSWKKCSGWQEFEKHCTDPILQLSS